MGRENLVQFKKMHTLCIHCGQLILRKISKIGATRCQILRVKCTKFDFSWGSAPDPAGGAYSAPPDHLAVFMGPTSKGKGGKEGGMGGEGERKGKRWHRLYIHCMFYKYATGLPPAGRLVPGATDVCQSFFGSVVPFVCPCVERSHKMVRFSSIKDQNVLYRKCCSL